ncbi:MAG: glycosyltransferase family 2 protein [Anaerolineae bacterium]
MRAPEPQTLPAEAIPPTAVSIVIPAFNEAQGLPRVINGLNAWRERGAEVIVIDDGSTDGTGEAARQTGVRVIRHHSNKGYGASLKSGVRAAHGEVVVTMDADGQHNPADVERLLGSLCDSDMAVGMRGQGSHTPSLRKPGKWVLAQVANYLAETKIPDLNSGFRAIRVETLKPFLHILPNGFSFSTTLTLALFKEGYNIAYVPITAAPRAGTSTVNPLRDGLNTVLLIIRTIALFDPLKVFLPASVMLFLVGLGYWILDSVVLRRLNIPSGAVIVLVSAVIVFMFGILADQVSAIRREKRE